VAPKGPNSDAERDRPQPKVPKSEVARQRDAARAARDDAESARNRAERARCMAEASRQDSEHQVRELEERVAFLEEQLSHDRAYIADMELQRLDSTANADANAALTREIAILNEELDQRSPVEPL
jgi:hypothetical protein